MINLTKGENKPLTTGTTKISVGISWDANVSAGADFDLDVIAIALDSKNGKVALNDDRYAVGYFSALKTDKGEFYEPEKAILHTGDNRTGDGEGDDEVINIDLAKLNPAVKSIIFIVNIYDAENRNQNFGQVKNPRANVYENDSTIPTFSFELDEDFSTERCLEIVQVYNRNEEWKVDALGTANGNNLKEELAKYGVPAEGNA